MRIALSASLKKAMQLTRATARNPADVLTKVREHLAERREHRRPPCPYEVDHDWERRLHEIIGVPWPCSATQEFWDLWPDVIAPFNSKGIQIGRGAFGGWGDGEPGLARAVWCLTRHLRPVNVVETGVARGFTSRVILEALEQNGAGHLWSIDLPPLLKPELHAQVGAAVGNRCRDRWSYIEGSSRQRLPELLSQLGQIDLFVHDSRHTEYNLRFELDRSWAALRSGGVLVADDIDLNWGFHSFTEAVFEHQHLICLAEPLRPDPPRFDGKGLFGVIRKVPRGHG